MKPNLQDLLSAAAAGSAATVSWQVATMMVNPSRQWHRDLLKRIPYLIEVGSPAYLTDLAQPNVAAAIAQQASRLVRDAAGDPLQLYRDTWRVILCSLKHSFTRTVAEHTRFREEIQSLLIRYVRWTLSKLPPELNIDHPEEIVQRCWPPPVFEAMRPDGWDLPSLFRNVRDECIKTLAPLFPQFLRANARKFHIFHISADDFDDLVSECWLKLCANIPATDLGHKEVPGIARVSQLARCCFIDECVRKADRRTRHLEAYSHHRAVSVECSPVSYQLEISDELQSIRKSLKKRDRDFWDIHTNNGLNSAITAKALRLTPCQVNRKFAKLTKRIRQRRDA